MIVKIKLRQQANLLQKLLTHDNRIPNQALVVKNIRQIRHASQRLTTDVLRGDTQDVSKNTASEALTRYDVASLRGIEGASASQFFECYQLFFDSQLNFTSRNRRPPKDPVNTVLSLAYTLLQGICEQAVYSVGFDPYLGVLHDDSYGRASLACDFAELQRHEIEFWVWQLFFDEVLTLSDFGLNSQANMSHRPCELLKNGRSRFYEAFSAIRNDLKKQALKNVWTWQKRICSSADDDHEILSVSEL